MKNSDMPAMPFENEPYAINALNKDLGPVASGLTKREMFAMAAMQGLCATCDSDGTWRHDEIDVAQEAVRRADRLLAELEKTK